MHVNKQAVIQLTLQTFSRNFAPVRQTVVIRVRARTHNFAGYPPREREREIPGDLEREHGPNRACFRERRIDEITIRMRLADVSRGMLFRKASFDRRVGKNVL
ncbi:hypothetical protein TNCV_4696631 [Trichonephila clavipes]|nr:hypothetical protein TNCV_4696631 [Trichonephila clavipes]